MFDYTELSEYLGVWSAILFFKYKSNNLLGKCWIFFVQLKGTQRWSSIDLNSLSNIKNSSSLFDAFIHSYIQIFTDFELPCYSQEPLNGKDFAQDINALVSTVNTNVGIDGSAKKYFSIFFRMRYIYTAQDI